MIERQQQELQARDQKIYTIREHLGMMLEPVLDLICCNYAEFDWICDMDFGMLIEDTVKHILHLKAIALDVPFETLEDPTLCWAAAQASWYQDPRTVSILTKHTRETFEWLRSKAIDRDYKEETEETEVTVGTVAAEILEAAYQQHTAKQPPKRRQKAPKPAVPVQQTVDQGITGGAG